MNRHSFPRWERLKLKRDFDRVFRGGKSIQNDFFTVIYVNNNLDFNRIAIIVKKKLGKAHDRNKIKRWIREAYRTMKPELSRGFDVVVIPRKALSEVLDTLNFHVIKNELRSLLKRIET